MGLFSKLKHKRHRKFIIPVDKLTTKEAEDAIKHLMSEYKAEIIFNEETGEINMDGEPLIPYQKEYWFPSPNDAKPDIDIIGENLDDPNI